MTRLKVSAEIKADITAIWMRLQGKSTAERYLVQFGKAARRLLEVPRSGASRPALGPNTRRLVIRPYVLIYDFDPADDSVTLLRIVHGRRRDQRRDGASGLTMLGVFVCASAFMKIGRPSRFREDTLFAGDAWQPGDFRRQNRARGFPANAFSIIYPA